MTLRGLKEYAQAEGVSARFGVNLESVSDLSRGIGLSETAECWEKVQRTSTRPHINLVPGGNGTGTHLTRADTWQQGTCLRSSVSTHFCGSFLTFLWPETNNSNRPWIGVGSIMSSDLPGHGHWSSTPWPYLYRFVWPLRPWQHKNHRSFVLGFWWLMAWFFIVTVGLPLFLGDSCMFVEITMHQCKTLIRERCLVC